MTPYFELTQWSENFCGAFCAMTLAHDDARGVIVDTAAPSPMSERIALLPLFYNAPSLQGATKVRGNFHFIFIHETTHAGRSICLKYAPALVLLFFNKMKICGV